jgi:hypothetical protein
VISRPTTEQIILDCRRELMETVLPAVSDPAVVVCLQMLENVLRNAATRAAHEIAWMAEEAKAMTTYAHEVGTRASSPELRAVLAATDAAGDAASLHLDACVAAYSTAGELLSCAIEAAFAAEDDDLVEQGVRLLQERTDREQEIKGEWAMTGRG